MRSSGGILKIANLSSKFLLEGFSVAEFTDDGNQLASLNKVDAWIPDLNKSDPSHLLKSVKTYLHMIYEAWLNCYLFTCCINK